MASTRRERLTDKDYAMRLRKRPGVHARAKRMAFPTAYWAGRRDMNSVTEGPLPVPEPLRSLLARIAATPAQPGLLQIGSYAPTIPRLDSPSLRIERK